MTPEAEKFYAECERELNRIRKQIDEMLSFSRKPEYIEPLMKQMRFVLEMMERVASGAQSPPGPKTAWDHIKE